MPSTEGESVLGRLALEGSPCAPQRANPGGAEVFHWPAEGPTANKAVLHEDGDGILVVRRARLDSRAYEESIHEIEAMLEVTNHQGLKPREIILAGQSGLASFEERWDFTRIAREIRAGNLRWVAYPCFERVGRDTAVVQQFLELLNRAGVDLYLTRDDPEPCGERWLETLRLSHVAQLKSLPD